MHNKEIMLNFIRNSRPSYEYSRNKYSLKMITIAYQSFIKSIFIISDYLIYCIYLICLMQHFLDHEIKYQNIEFNKSVITVLLQNSFIPRSSLLTISLNMTTERAPCMN